MRKARKQAEKFNVDKNLIERIDKCERSRQHTLDLSDLDISCWPIEVLGFANLKVLKASKNKFVEISSLQHFRLIEQLDMSRNLLTSISNIKFSTLHDLRIVDFSWNHIDVLPDELSKLPLLEFLYLSHNELVSHFSSPVYVYLLHAVADDTGLLCRAAISSGC